MISVGIFLLFKSLSCWRLTFSESRESGEGSQRNQIICCPAIFMQIQFKYHPMHLDFTHQGGNKESFSDPNMIFYDIVCDSRYIDKISLFPNFQSILRLCYACFAVSYTVALCHYVGNYYVDIINRQFSQLFRQTSEFVRNVFTQSLYLQRLLLAEKS